jgi:pimeloyl-ACP methyl ester carboxylesterase
MLSIVDAFSKSIYREGSEEPQLLNFLGLSYGTFLGQTFASMFPDRVGRMVLDAVMDPDDRVNGNDVAELISVDAAFSTFFVCCNLAGPS